MDEEGEVASSVYAHKYKKYVERFSLKNMRDEIVYGYYFRRDRAN